MLKIFKKPKFIKIVCAMLVAVFAVNVAGCGKADNGLVASIDNYDAGKGGNTTGYTVYSQSTFDQMSEEIFMGYLLSGREFTLVVVPGMGDGSDENPYTIKSSDNILYSTALSGVYKYNEYNASYENPDKKLLLYYVTDLELRSWFVKFVEDDNFLSNVMEFASSTIDIEKGSRYTCENLVNLGSGLDDKSFCGEFKNGKYENGVINNSTGIFNDEKTGGMILFFGYSSIEGYVTYNDIVEYKGSAIANTLSDLDCSNGGCYNQSNIRAFDFFSALNENKQVLQQDYGYSASYLNGINANSFSLNNDDIKSLKQDIVSLVTEKKMVASKPGYQTLKTTYEMIGTALLADYGYSSIAGLRNAANSNKNYGSIEDRDKWAAVYEMTSMITNEGFRESAQKEAFDIKMSVVLYRRYNKVVDYPKATNLVTGYSYNARIGKNIAENGSSVSYEKALQLRNGNDVNSPTNNNYLLLVTAEGFVIDRGTESDQKIMGWSDMLGFSSLLSELVRIDGCPNATIASKMFNMLQNLKIYVGAGLIWAGLGTAAIAIGISLPGVFAKLAALASVTPIPGARIVAIVLIGIAALTTLTVGAITLFSGINEKNRLKGLGASDENYCNTYVATFNSLFESISLTIPVYHYQIPKEEDASANSGLSLNYCDEYYTFSENKGKCVHDETKVEVDPKSIPLYYYADREKSEALNLPGGAPALLYFQDGVLVDCIYGASTPDFIIEILRLWGLLSMREIVYNAQIESNKINVYHTSNTNARTHTIYSAKQCFNLDYAEDLYKIDSNSFCYDISGNKGVNYVEFNGSSGIDYVNTYGKGSELLLDGVGTSVPTSSNTGLVTAINNKYNNYYSYTINSKFNIKKDEFKIQVIPNDERVITTFDLENKIIGSTTYESIKQFTYENEDVKEYYLLAGNSIYVTSSLQANSLAIKIATYEQELTPFTVVDVHNQEYNEIDFLRFIYGSLVILEDETNMSIPIYYTVTVKEAPQANYYTEYKDGPIKETCDEGKYMYYRDNKLWFDNSSKCLADDKVKSKDKAYSTIHFNSNDYRYYSSSIQVGTIELSLDSTGATLVNIEWVSF